LTRVKPAHPNLADYHCYVEHKREEENYSHSELCTYLNGIEAETPRTVRSAILITLTFALDVIKVPDE